VRSVRGGCGDTGPFMLAECHGREASITSGTVLASPVVSLGAITLYLAT
jgi:hypothetical protein